MVEIRSAGTRRSRSWELLGRWTLAGALVLGLGACRDTTPDEAAPRIDVQRYRVELSSEEFALGGDHPLVTIVVFTDYACPPCGRTWQVMENLVEDYGEDLRVVYRSYTVPGFPRGEQAAEAAFAAGAQGKFWEMHRRLFEHPGAFDRPSLRAHAEAIGLDVPKFLDDLDTGVHSAPRMQHRRQATQLGIVGLPATFTNGVYLAGFADEAAWHGVVDQEIVRAKELLAQGTPRAELYPTIMKKASTRAVSAPQGAEKLQEDLAAKKQAGEGGPVKLIPPESGKRYRIEPNGAAIGPDDAPVVVVEFLDTQCPFCRRAWSEELQALIEKRKDRVKFAVRHLPLAIHPEAKGTAAALLAADRQGKFWPMHAKLMALEDGQVGRDVFVTIAEELGLDVDQFLAHLDDPAVAEQVAEDQRLAVSVGVTGTPAFFVNGRYVRGYRPGQLAALIDEELEYAKEVRAKGIPADEVFEHIMNEAVQPEDFPNQ